MVAFFLCFYNRITLDEPNTLDSSFWFDSLENSHEKVLKIGIKRRFQSFAMNPVVCLEKEKSPEAVIYFG